MNVWDVIETPGHTSKRLYQIIGIHLGAINQEDVIEMIPMDRNMPDAHGETAPIYVPKEMLECGINAGLFMLTQLEEAQ